MHADSLSWCSPRLNAVRFRNVSKHFALAHAKQWSLLRSLGGFIGAQNQEVEEFWALTNVNFEVEAGETLGIIGPNGSGKSTILKLLTGTLVPDEGTIETSGKVFGLLELGAGFHPDLTGRENIFLNGSFLGIRRQEMSLLYNQIVEFAELERFIDTPVKHYSSGMYMRLGFAIAIAVSPEVMVIDEVLAVGDAAFARKCYQALSNVKKSGRTMLFVSHDPLQVRRFCDRVLWLDQGRVRQIGKARDVIQAYLQASALPAKSDITSTVECKEFGGDGPLAIGPVYFSNSPNKHSQAIIPGESVAVKIRYHSDGYLDGVVFGCSIRRSDGLYIHDASSALSHGEMYLSPGEGVVECALGPISLGPGIYQLSVAAWPFHDRVEPYHMLRDAITLFVGKTSAHQRGLAFIPSTWHFGNATTDLTPADEVIETIQPDMITPRTVARWSKPPSQIRMGNAEDEFLGEGWHPVESWPPSIRWIGTLGTLSLTQDVGQGTLIIAACRPFHSDNVTTGKLRVNGQHLTNFQILGMDFEDIVVPLEPVTEPTPLEIEIEMAETFIPAAVGIDPDTRELGLAVRGIRLE